MGGRFKKIVANGWQNGWRNGGPPPPPGFRSAMAILAVLPIVIALLPAAFAQRPSVLAPKATESLVLDIARAAGDVLVAVGERGHILRSEDQGDTWTQVPSPTRTFLSAVACTGATCWAVGHLATILKSEDSGATWSLEHYSTNNIPIEGVEMPFLLFDLHLEGDKPPLVSGHFGFLLQADADGNWSHAQAKRHKPGEYDAPLLSNRLNGIARVANTNGTLWLASDLEMIEDAEGDLLNVGTLFEAVGDEWKAHHFQTEGEVFHGLLALPDGALLAFGNPGVLYRLDPASGKSTRIEGGGKTPLHGAFLTRENHLWVVGSSGTILKSTDLGKTFTRSEYPGWPTLTGGFDPGDGRILLASDRGILETTP